MSVAQQNSVNMAPASLSPAMWDQMAFNQQKLSQAMADGVINSTITVVPLSVVATRKIDQLIAQLPLRVLAKIARINFINGNPMMFSVAYLDGHRVEFLDIEKFPSDADVAKVLIELP
jgi:DNA-binding GntR family transcriptional regulator